MGKKDYLAREEQKIWGMHRRQGIVDNELVKQVFPDISDNKRNKLLHSLYRKRYLRKAK